MITVNCLNCEAAFEVRTGEFNKGHGKFCSRPCYHAFRSRRPEPVVGPDVVLIPLTLGQWARVDRTDYDSIPLLREAKWSSRWCPATRTFYCQWFPGRKRGTPRTPVLMHRLITGAETGQHVNHWDFDGTNNTRTNLQVCTPGENRSYERPRVYPGKTSRFKGVYRGRRNTRWTARIQHRGKQTHLGQFDTEEEAAAAYNARALELFGEFALINKLI